jgi:hypothetical protein
VPERALTRARSDDVLALSAANETEIVEVFGRPKFARSITAARRERVFSFIREAAVWFDPAERLTDCRDVKATSISSWRLRERRRHRLRWR